MHDMILSHTYFIFDLSGILKKNSMVVWAESTDKKRIEEDDEESFIASKLA